MLPWWSTEAPRISKKTPHVIGFKQEKEEILYLKCTKAIYTLTHTPRVVNVNSNILGNIKKKKRLLSDFKKHNKTGWAPGPMLCPQTYCPSQSLSVAKTHYALLWCRGTLFFQQINVRRVGSSLRKQGGTGILFLMLPHHQGILCVSTDLTRRPGLNQSMMLEKCVDGKLLHCRGQPKEIWFCCVLWNQ